MISTRIDLTAHTITEIIQEIQNDLNRGHQVVDQILITPVQFYDYGDGVLNATCIEVDIISHYDESAKKSYLFFGQACEGEIALDLKDLEQCNYKIYYMASCNIGRGHIKMAAAF